MFYEIVELSSTKNPAKPYPLRKHLLLSLESVNRGLRSILGAA